MTDTSPCRSDARRACACGQARPASANPIAHRVGSEAWLREVAERHRREARAVLVNETTASGRSPSCRHDAGCAATDTTLERSPS
ncbi:MAG: hypothetical protein ACOC1G_08930 [Phycisphaeraceae bacterium]